MSSRAVELFAALSPERRGAVLERAQEALEQAAVEELAQHRARAGILEDALAHNGDQPRELGIGSVLAEQAAEPELEADQPDCDDDAQPEPAAASPPPEGEPPSEPPAPAPDDSPPPADDPPRHNEPFTQDDLERHTRVLLDERSATPTAIATAMCRQRAHEQGRPFGGSAGASLVRRVRGYLAELEQQGKIEEIGRMGRGARYGWAQESPQEPADAEPDRGPAPSLAGRSEPAGGAEDVLVTVQREIRQTLGHGPTRIPDIARKFDRPPAQVAQAMELLKRDGDVEKIPGGQYQRTDRPAEEYE